MATARFAAFHGSGSQHCGPLFLAAWGSQIPHFGDSRSAMLFYGVATAGESGKIVLLMEIHQHFDLLPGKSLALADALSQAQLIRFGPTSLGTEDLYQHLCLVVLLEDDDRATEQARIVYNKLSSVSRL